MRKLLNHKTVIALSGLIVAGGTFAGYTFLQKNNMFGNNSAAYYEISGLNAEDSVQVDLIAEHVQDSQIKSVNHVQNSKQSDPYIFYRMQDDPGQTYKLFFTIHDKKNSDHIDIAFGIDRNTGVIKASANGLSPATQTSLSINDQKIIKPVPADWSGRNELKAADQTISNGSAKICMDLGGFRGGTLSVCHGVKNNIVQAQIFDAAALGGFLAEDIQENYVAALQRMTDQMTNVAFQQIAMVGMMLDAKHQLESQRIFRELQAEAHRDYHPNTAMCTVGTLVRHLTQTEARMQLVRATISKQTIERELVSGETITYSGRESDTLTRLEDFSDYNCRDAGNGIGLENFCNEAAQPQNADADVLLATFNQNTIDYNPDDPDLSDDERNIHSLIRNLTMERPHAYIPPSLSNTQQMVNLYDDLRSLATIRQAVTNSLSHQIAEKSVSPDTDENVGPYMRALVQNKGLNDGEIDELYGQNPSYYSQMKFLTTTMFQDPNFFAGLYTQPANVTRMEAAMTGIQIMQGRDMQNLLERRELLISLLLEMQLREESRNVNNIIVSIVEP